VKRKEFQTFKHNSGQELWLSPKKKPAISALKKEYNNQTYRQWLANDRPT
jgi:hypothetical protein